MTRWRLRQMGHLDKLPHPPILLIGPIDRTISSIQAKIRRQITTPRSAIFGKGSAMRIYRVSGPEEFERLTGLPSSELVISRTRGSKPAPSPPPSSSGPMTGPSSGNPASSNGKTPAPREGAD
jgi:hypothetical protein